MATLNVRLDDKLKNEAYAVLEKLNITPTEAVRLLFQYVAENGRMPVNTHCQGTTGQPTRGH